MARLSRHAFGLIEALVAIAVFAAVFLPLIGVFTDTGTRQLAAVRDYAAALNVAERFVANASDLLENGKTDSAGDMDLTALVLSDPVSAKALEKMTNVAARLECDPVAGEDRLYRVTMRLTWGDRAQHRLELSAYKYAPSC